MDDPTQITYGLSENVIIFDLGLIGQGQIQGQICFENFNFGNMNFFNIERMHKFQPNLYHTMP